MCGTCQNPKCPCSNEHLLKSVHFLQVNPNIESGVQNSEPRGSAEKPSGKDKQGDTGEQGSNGHAHCEVCELAGHSKEACPVVKAAQQDQEEGQETAQQEDEDGWHTVLRDAKPCKTQPQSKKRKKSKGKKKARRGLGSGEPMSV